jgi:hypothetical protein
VSLERPTVDLEDLPNPICDYCGGEIAEDEQECPALEDGRCAP